MSRIMSQKWLSNHLKIFSMLFFKVSIALKGPSHPLHLAFSRQAAATWCHSLAEKTVGSNIRSYIGSKAKLVGARPSSMEVTPTFGAKRSNSAAAQNMDRERTKMEIFLTVLRFKTGTMTPLEIDILSPGRSRFLGIPLAAWADRLILVCRFKPLIINRHESVILKNWSVTSLKLSPWNTWTEQKRELQRCKPPATNQLWTCPRPLTRFHPQAAQIAP